jgi:NADH:ubiquinone reductase (H+-translocating)
MARIPRVVIVGAGFGGLFCAQGLRKSPCEVVLIDRQNHHLFQPLLYQVATGFLGINDVAMPIRSLFKNKGNITVAMAEVTSVDPVDKRVITASKNFHYDYLVLATGAQYHFFGNDKWMPHVHVLKSIPDAISLRQRILNSFEAAEMEEDEDGRKRLLTYIVIGGGPTGVEVAGTLADVVNYALPREFRRIKPSDVKILLVEAGPRLLNTMPEKISKYTKHALEKKGVLVHCNCAVSNIEHQRLSTTSGVIDAHTILWAAGVRPVPIFTWLNVNPDRRGGIPVAPSLAVAGMSDVFVVGDAATCIQDGKPLPALASVAKQQGKYLAKNLSRLIAGRRSEPFHYKDLGTMATIGRNAAVADFGRFAVTGWLAWMLWGIVHIYFLSGFRNRSVVFVTWVWTYLTFGIGSRVIWRIPRQTSSLENQ